MPDIITGIQVFELGKYYLNSSKYLQDYYFGVAIPEYFFTHFDAKLEKKIHFQSY